MNEENGPEGQVESGAERRIRELAEGMRTLSVRVTAGEYRSLKDESGEEEPAWVLEAFAADLARSPDRRHRLFRPCREKARDWLKAYREDRRAVSALLSGAAESEKGGEPC